MRYAYIGETTKYHAELIMAKHKAVVVTGEYANGKVELGVPSDLSDKAIELYIKTLERGRL